MTVHHRQSVIDEALQLAPLQPSLCALIAALSLSSSDDEADDDSSDCFLMALNLQPNS